MVEDNPVVPTISVIMPSYNQQTFLARSLESLRSQTFTEWELIIIDDGSTDGTSTSVQPYLVDPRIRLYRLGRNLGMGAALNHGIRLSCAPLIAYLPTDDVYYQDHLASLIEALRRHPEAVMAVGGVRHHYNRTAPGQIPGFPLQLVQIAHRKTPEQWIERDELVTDDLERMYWSKLVKYGSRLETGKITCVWSDHPEQRHKILQEPVGGINLYRQRFQITHPLRFHTTVGNRMDEIEHYKRFRERPDTPPAPDGLKILIVGELAYNPERILALEERGHQLFGLWMPEPYWYNNVGPLPFGHVTDLPRTNWQKAVRELKPDVIYALLNWQAVPFVHAVLQEIPDIPFIWHFKEGPFICLEKGTWPKLIEIYQRADGHIFSSPEMRGWFETVIPAAIRDHPSLLLDGDLPKADWFRYPPSTRITQQDGEFHTVVPGRPIGLHPHSVAELAENGIHLHFYGNFTHGQWKEWIEKTLQIAPRYLHLHSHIDQGEWATEFSRYDAGWLHYFKSENYGELRRANWDDLNYPARISTLAAAGLPVLQRRNTGHVVATQNLVQKHDIGLFFEDFSELRSQLEDRERMSMIRARIFEKREQFTFDHHVESLVSFFREVMSLKAKQPGIPPYRSRPSIRVNRISLTQGPTPVAES